MKLSVKKLRQAAVKLSRAGDHTSRRIQFSTRCSLFVVGTAVVHQKPLLRHATRLYTREAEQRPPKSLAPMSGFWRPSSQLSVSFRPSWTRTLTDVVTASPARTCVVRATVSCAGL